MGKGSLPLKKATLGKGKAQDPAVFRRTPGAKWVLIPTLGLGKMPKLHSACNPDADYIPKDGPISL